MMSRISRSLYTPLRVAVTSSRSITTSTTTTATSWSTVSPIDGTETIETYVSSETHKVNVVHQKEVFGEDGMPQRVTIPPPKWREDHGSDSEAIVKAEKHESPSFQDMQASTLKMLKKKDGYKGEVNL